MPPGCPRQEERRVNRSARLALRSAGAVRTVACPPPALLASAPRSRAVSETEARAPPHSVRLSRQWQTRRPAPPRQARLRA